MKILLAVLLTVCLLTIGLAQTTTAQFQENQEPTIIVNTAYDDVGHCLLVWGNISRSIPNEPVLLKVLSESGNLVEIRQLDVSDDNTFGAILISERWIPLDETYFVEVYYNKKSINTEKFFVSSFPSEAPLYPIDDFGGYGLYNVILRPGTILNMTIDPDSKSVTYLIDNQFPSYKELTCRSDFYLNVPRHLFDAKNINGTDVNFLILADGKEIDHTESDAGYSRSVRSKIPSNTEEIKLVGTQIVPEFGQISGLILAVSLISIISLFRTGFMKTM